MFGTLWADYMIYLLLSFRKNKSDRQYMYHNITRIPYICYTVTSL